MNILLKFLTFIVIVSDEIIFSYCSNLHNGVSPMYYSQSQYFLNQMNPRIFPFEYCLRPNLYETLASSMPHSCVQNVDKSGIAYEEQDLPSNMRNNNYRSLDDQNYNPIRQNFNDDKKKYHSKRNNYVTYEYLCFLDNLKNHNRITNIRAYQANFLKRKLKKFNSETFFNVMKTAFEVKMLKFKVLDSNIKLCIVNLMVKYFKINYYNAIIFFTFWNYFSYGFKNCIFDENKVLHVQIYKNIWSGEMKKIPFENLLQNWSLHFLFYNGYQMYLTLIELFIQIQKDSMVPQECILRRFKSFELRSYYTLEHFLSVF
ncbi:hypothetical protein H311_01000 [Anncaliia algerae PRA109]|nr:hypothetical protein H311_01000 [Anncaliia algerae PRA109]